MKIEVINALIQLEGLKRSDSEIRIIDFSDSYSVLYDSLQSLSEGDIKIVLIRLLTILNNSNVESVYMKQIPIDFIEIINKDKLLSVIEINSLFISLSDYYIVNAEKWIYEVFYCGYVLYAIRCNYSITEIRQGLLNSTKKDVDAFLNIIKSLYDPLDSWQEASDFLYQIINFIENEIFKIL